MHSLVVFDLDFTLWDCGGTWCDCTSPPYRGDSSRVFDSAGRQIRLYDDVPKIMDWCDGNGINMALASRTEQPAWARELLELLGIENRFAFAEIYPSSKLKHFRALGQASRISPKQMLFFDDEMRNITEVGSIGVKSIHVPHGMNWRLFRESLFPDSSNDDSKADR